MFKSRNIEKACVSEYSGKTKIINSASEGKVMMENYTSSSGNIAHEN